VPNPKAIAQAFVDRINSCNPEGLSELMTEDHSFVDATGVRHSGRSKMQAGWNQYFQTFPDYRIQIDEFHHDGGTVIMFGWASGSFHGEGPTWRVPAAWRAAVSEDRIREWVVYCDVEPMLRSMGIDRFKG
jgi:ketosteroid isomerase-like protein